jgi:hypothetical protein
MGVIMKNIFKFITKKYENRIEELEWQIEAMMFEWKEEKQLYDNITRQKFYDQKVYFVIGGLDLHKHKKIHRPLYGLTKDEARTIAKLVKEKVQLQGFLCLTDSHWDESKDCYVIDVQVG